MRYMLDPAAGLTQVLADGTNTYLYGNGRIAQYQAEMQYFGADGLGSVRQLYDATGQVLANNRYDPYGNLMSQYGEATSVFAFTGEQYDAATGLEYLRARYYSSAQGRFTTRDVWEGDNLRPQSLNAYTYAYNNPIRFYDSDGRCFPYCYIFAYLAYRNIPRENLSMGSRFVAGLNIFLVSDIAALDVNATDNLWAAVNGDKCGLTTEQRIQAYLNYVDSSIKEAVSIYIIAEMVAGFRQALSVSRPPKPASSPVGRRGSPMDVRSGTNAPGEVNGIRYSGHAFDQMQSEGFVPSVVEDVLARGNSYPGRYPNTTTYYEPGNNISVVVNSDTGTIITVTSGRLRPR